VSWRSARHFSGHDSSGRLFRGAFGEAVEACASDAAYARGPDAIAVARIERVPEVSATYFRQRHTAPACACRESVASSFPRRVRPGAYEARAIRRHQQRVRFWILQQELPGTGNAVRPRSGRIDENRAENAEAIFSGVSCRWAATTGSRALQSVFRGDGSLNATRRDSVPKQIRSLIRVPSRDREKCRRAPQDGPPDQPQRVPG
jgi:hypothetical protein